MTALNALVVAAVAAFGPADPATIWNREELYKVPKTWGNQDPFKGEVTPIWIEGEPYRGKPTRLFAFLGLPEDASPSNRVPGIVLVHGGAGTAYPEWVRLWTRRGYAAIAVDNCGQLPALGADGKWIANPDGGPRGWGETDMKRLDEPIKDQWMYHAIAASVRAHSYLRSLDCVDTANVGVTGISWGGFQTCILAALDDRFTYAVPVYGCAFNYEPDGIMSEERKGPEAVAWSKVWDPVRFLPYAKIPFLWVDGTNDFAFQLDRVMRSADLVKAESQFCTRLRMVHAHGAPGEAPAEILAFADRYARGGMDIVRVTSTDLDGDELVVKFRANGRRLVKAELLWTCDGEETKAPERKWDARAIADFKPDAGIVRVRLDSRTTQAVVNLIDEKGLIFSSRTVNTPVFAQTPLERKISADHRILVSDRWGGGHRIIFDFNGRKGWIVEPEKAAEDRPWVWTMQWMGAYLYRTGAPQLVKKGWYHVHLEAFDTRADDEGLKVLTAFQSYLVDGLGFAKKANLIGMSWGGFYSIRYASEHPENVSRIYLDAPLLNVYTLPKNWAKDPVERIGSWAKSEPTDPANDPRMAVNRAAMVAQAKIPVLLLYGKSDDVVDPSRNCEPFLNAFRAAGGSVAVEARDAWGHHPHGLDEDEVGRIVEFFEASAHPGDRASFGPLSPSARPYERQYLWPEERMPDFQPHQIAAKWGETKKRDFDRAANRKPFIEWYAPVGSNKTDVCVLTISGGGFNMTCDAERLQPAIDRLVAAGITVADVTYRTPRPEGMAIHQSGWEDVQRAVRVVKSEAAKRGFSPEKIGATGISAGAKALLLVATSSETRAYDPVDAIDELPANLAFAVVQAPAYVLTDGALGQNENGGEGADLVPELKMDAKTCPMCFLHGGADGISPLGSTRLFRELRARGIPAELHLFGGRWHGFHGDQNIGEAGEAYDHWWDRAMEFILPPAKGEPFPSEMPEGLVLCEANDPQVVKAVERWEELRRKGVQTDLHLSGARGPTTWRGRIREFLNRGACLR